MFFNELITLEVGMNNGLIGIWNIQEQTSEWIVDNSETPEIPIGAIWELTWLMRLHGMADEKKEVVISACEDGRICQWILRKTMECVVLMRLKRTPTGKREWKKMEAMISRNAVAFCLTFRPGQDNIYLVGTGEGNIQECSCSNSDQYLNTYSGHSGPVYCVTWSPFADDVFLSGSGDWTMRLWLHDHTTSIMTLASSQSAILDLCWSPVISTVFACVHSHSIEIWDLNVTVLDPVTVFIPDTDAELRVLKFSDDGRALIVGDNDGRVTLFMLKNFPPPPKNQLGALMMLLKTSSASVAEELEGEDNS